MAQFREELLQELEQKTSSSDEEEISSHKDDVQDQDEEERVEEVLPMKRVEVNNEEFEDAFPRKSHWFTSLCS